MSADVENSMTLLSMDPLTTSEEDSRLAALRYGDLARHLAQGQSAALSGARVIVVGGGVMGLMTALFLTRAGARVELFEAQSLGAAASGRNAGGIYAFGREIDEVALARVSMNLWEELTVDGVDSKFVRKGHAIVAMTEYERQLLEIASHRYELAGLPVDLLSAKDTLALLPGVTTRNAGALVGTSDAQGYPLTAVASIVSKLHAAGSIIHDHHPVVNVIQRGGSVRGVRSAAGVTEADQVLLCAGPWMRDFSESAGCELPIRPRRSQIMVTERVPGLDGFPFVSGNRIYARRTHAGNIVVGGGGPWEEGGYNVTNSYEALKFIAKHMSELFPGLVNVPVIRAFAGTVELTADHLPLFGASPAVDGLWISAGYNGHGFGMSAAMGRLGAELVASHCAGAPIHPAVTAVIEHWRPDRFNEGGRVSHG